MNPQPPDVPTGVAGPVLRAPKSASWSVMSGLLMVGVVLLLLSAPAVSISNPWQLVILLVTTFATLAIHEGGHLVASLLSGFEITALRLGPARLWKRGAGWALRLNAHGVFSGGVVAFPKDNERWRERMLAVIAAGPLATLLSAATIYAAVCGYVLPGAIGWPFIEISLVIFILGLLPNSMEAASPNDAALFLAIWRDGRQANSLFLYHLVLQQQRAGREAGDFPLWLINLIATFQGRREFMAIYADIVAAWCFERGHGKAGEAWDRRALLLAVGCTKEVRQVCLANSASFDLAYRRDVAGAKRKLKELRVGALTSPSLRHRAEAIRALVEGRVRSSLTEIRAAREWLPIYQQDRGWEHGLLRRLHAFAMTYHSIP